MKSRLSLGILKALEKSQLQLIPQLLGLSTARDFTPSEVLAHFVIRRGSYVGIVQFVLSGKIMRIHYSLVKLLNRIVQFDSSASLEFVSHQRSVSLFLRAEEDDSQVVRRTLGSVPLVEADPKQLNDAVQKHESRSQARGFFSV